MRGQWIGNYLGTNSGQAILEIDELRESFEGVAYLYDSDASLPSTFVPFRTIDKSSSFWQTLMALLAAAFDMAALPPRTGKEANTGTLGESPEARRRGVEPFLEPSVNLLRRRQTPPAQATACRISRMRPRLSVFPFRQSAPSPTVAGHGVVTDTWPKSCHKPGHNRFRFGGPNVQRTRKIRIAISRSGRRAHERQRARLF